MPARMVDLELGAVIRLRPERLHGQAIFDLADVGRVTVVSHGGGESSKGVPMPWSVVERLDGERVNVLDGDIEDAIIERAPVA